MTTNALGHHAPVKQVRPERPPLADRATIIAALRTPEVNAGDLATWMESAKEEMSTEALNQFVLMNHAALWTACNRRKGK